MQKTKLKISKLKIQSGKRKNNKLYFHVSITCLIKSRCEIDFTTKETISREEMRVRWLILSSIITGLFLD